MTTPLNGTIKETFSALCWTVATPFAYKALKAVEREDWLWLVSQEIKPADYLCAHTFFGDYQVAKLLAKFPEFKLGKSRQAAALESFWKAEKQCYITNERLAPLLGDLDHFGGRVRQFVLSWRREIRRVIGTHPDYRELQNVRFGPGSTFANVGDKILIADKFDSGYTITEGAVSLLSFFEQTSWLRNAARDHSIGMSPDGESIIVNGLGFGVRHFREVRGNRFTTVAKDAKTDRGICIEPSGNVSMQLALGGLIDSLMGRRYSNWSKATMQEYHRTLARIGSMTNGIATIDLSNASDTVSINLLRLILPPAWFRLLDETRSSFTCVHGKWVKLEKFSSMGNGFTFELETLVFRSLIETIRQFEDDGNVSLVPGVDYSCFGDDIIVPRKVSRSVLSALKFFGFTPNERKTFIEGPFRESCGGDYFRGYEVRPHFIRKDVVTPADHIALANGIRRFVHRYNLTGWWAPQGALSIWRVVIKNIPSDIRRCRGPERLGDLVIHDDEKHWNVRVRNSIRYFRVWRPVANQRVSWDHYRPGVVLTCALYGVPSGSPPFDALGDANESWRRSGVVPRVNGAYISGYRFGRVAFS